jgi:hypothetical protein
MSCEIRIEPLPVRRIGAIDPRDDGIDVHFVQLQCGGSAAGRRTGIDGVA